jgi:hypothetical protein
MDSSGLCYNSESNSYDYDNEILTSIKGGEFLGQLI